MQRFPARFQWVLVAIFAILASGVQAVAQSSAELPVIVAVLDDYPAFQVRPEQSGSQGCELRALVFRRSPTGENHSIVILNPAHVNAETLRDALQVLHASKGDQPGVTRNNLVALGVTRRQRPPAAGTAEGLEAKLLELRSAPVVQLSSLGGMGRSVAIADLSKYLLPR